MKLPLTVERVAGEYWPVITDADGKELANQEVELDENEIRELVLCANAYHKVKQVVEDAITNPTGDKDALLAGRIRMILDPK
jgi:hypothetical protein